MKKICIVVFCLCGIVKVNGQTKLHFCTFVNSYNLDCVFDNVKFITTPDSSRDKLFMMLDIKDSIGSDKVTYQLFKIDSTGKEVYLDSVLQQVKSSWKTVWQPYQFQTPGKYMVRVYTAPGNLLVNRGFEFLREPCSEKNEAASAKRDELPASKGRKK